MTESADDIRTRLEGIFAERVGLFYRVLHITPPYDSVEKAKLLLHDRLHGQDPGHLQTLVMDDVAVGRLFTEIVTDSGLAAKHRGIIQNLLASDPDLPPACGPIADAYRQ
jgi:hypothetical protein